MVQQKNPKNVSLLFLIFFIVLTIMIISRLTQPDIPDIPFTYTDLLSALENQNVQSIVIRPDLDVPNIGTADVIVLGVRHSLYISDISHLTILLNNHPEITVDNLPPERPSWFMQMLPFILIMGVTILILYIIFQNMQGGGRGAMNFGKSRAKMIQQDTRKVTFAQVAGLDEEKAELAEIVDFLKSPDKYRNIGARIPRGVLLVGPPGTGKTYLARAVAGEANVPFYSISGSDFVEMFVGVGASRVRDLFEQAKRNPASIIMIDEIDAVGRRRGAGLGGGHDEREQTLNQLLVEMDGFGVNEGVIVIAATNRPDILDPALLRPGRFDRRITVDRPDIKGREEVLKVHSEGKKLSDDISLKIVAQTTAGFTPADLENLMNESALLAARDNKKNIDMESIKQAFIKMGIGTEKKSRVITEKERMLIACHEAGHAICHEVLPEIDSTYMISIIPTGRAGGYVMPLPGEDRMGMGKRFMEQQIVSLLGGRAAETVVLKDITTGAANDIEKATSMARNMVVKFGMSEAVGPIQLGNDNDEVFLGRDFAHTRNYGEQVASLIDTEIKRIVEESYNEAIRIITTYIDVHTKIVDLLLKKERISGDEIRRLFPEGVIVKKDNPVGMMK